MLWLIIFAIIILALLRFARRPRQERLQNDGSTPDDDIENMFSAARNNNVVAQYDAGMYCLENAEVQGNDKESVKWFRKAADHGHFGAQYALGYMYYRGIGVSKDEKEAGALSLKAAVGFSRKDAEQGVVLCQLNLARMYEDGEGVPQDQKEAVKWYRRAAAQGDLWAQKKLRMYE